MCLKKTRLNSCWGRFELTQEVEEGPLRLFLILGVGCGDAGMPSYPARGDKQVALGRNK